MQAPKCTTYQVTGKPIFRACLCEKIEGIWCCGIAIGLVTTILAQSSVPKVRVVLPAGSLFLAEDAGFDALWLPDHGGVYRFATYNGAVIEHLATRDDATAVEIVIRSAQHRLFIDAASASGRKGTVWLDGPKSNGTFGPVVQEMLDVELSIKLERRSDGVVIFNGTGKHGGLEIESLEESIAVLETK